LTNVVKMKWWRKTNRIAMIENQETNDEEKARITDSSKLMPARVESSFLSFSFSW
jgi:hypothetical protein